MPSLRGSLPTRLAAAAEPPPLPAVVAPAITAAEPAVPEPVESAVTEPNLAEVDAAPTLTGPVVVATAVPTIGGAEITLSSSVVAKAVEPTAADRAGEIVPLPRRRPHTAAIPLPRPRPEIALEQPALSGRIITDAEIAKHALH